VEWVLWILRTRAPWKDLPDRYPRYQSCHRRFQKWQKDGRFEVILQVLAEDLVQRGKLDLRLPLRRNLRCTSSCTAGRLPRRFSIHYRVQVVRSGEADYRND